MGMALIKAGTLGPSLFYLGWWDSFLTILFFNMLGMIPPAYMATFGPKMGLRAMTIPRYLDLMLINANPTVSALDGGAPLFWHAPMSLLAWDGICLCFRSHHLCQVNGKLNRGWTSYYDPFRQ